MVAPILTSLPQKTSAELQVLDAPLYRGTACLCQKLAPVPGRRERYAILTQDGRIIGLLRWHRQRRQYVFLPGAETAWTSRAVSEIGLWLRRLTRETLAARMSAQGANGQEA